MIPIEITFREAIKERLNEVANEEFSACEQRIRNRMGEFVSGTIIRLIEYVKIDHTGRSIVLTIEMPKEKTDGQSN